MSEAGETTTPRHARRETIAGAALALVVVLALAGTFLLYRISERVGDLERTGAAPPAEEVQLPPPTRGSARALAEDFDRTTRRLSRPIDSMLSELQGARLGQVAPALDLLRRNTSALPGTGQTLERLARQTQGLNSLGPSIDGLTPSLNGLGTDLDGLVRAVPRLSRELTSTRRRLDSLGNGVNRVGGGLSTTAAGLDRTNDGLDRIVTALAEATRALDETRKAIERTNECLGRPVVCGGNNGSPVRRPR